MEPDFKEVDQVLFSTLNFNNLKRPNKMRDSFVGPFNIIKLIGKMQWKSNSQWNVPGNSHSFQKKIPTPPEIVEVEDSPVPVKKIIKARKITLNSKDQRQYLVRFNNQTADKDKWLAEDDIPDGNLHLRRFRVSNNTEQSHK
ncbi:hypothetical protein O181_071553 [Austropuccinia psidii MF-1]|uniref:Chromo domain-containing protein n=1 Tax=Austropuccinia psidii MF-1 TaxID=1389203 RepID=A0A9Q3F5S7_9BASI|nr:hypothetical protein [Austropuccinia psidii MF-1]